MKTLSFDARILFCVVGNEDIRSTSEEWVTIRESLIRLIEVGDLARAELKRIEGESTFFSSGQTSGRSNEQNRS